MSNDVASPRPPMHTPIPLGSDRRIDERAVQLADCRADLTDGQRHLLARVLAYRCRAFRPPPPGTQDPSAE